MVDLLCRWPVVLLLVLASPVVVFAQQPASIQLLTLPLSTEPLPEGQRVIASDGDTVVIEGDARVRIVRRRPAFVRIVADAERRFAIVVAEHLKAQGDTPTRLSDKAYTFSSLEGQWPLVPKWEGAVWLEEQLSLHGGGIAGLNVETTEGAILFMRRGPDDDLRPNAARVTLTFMGFGVSGVGGIRQPFDVVERQKVADAVQNMARNGASSQSAVGSGGIGFSSWMSTSTGPIGPPPTDAPPAPTGAVRVGGNIAAPRKLHHVEPVTPDLARSARLSGVVILEITIGADGAVSNARVLRSIPLLDQAAIDAVRQWRFEPTMLNGQAVPVIITAPVSFGPP